MRKRKKHFIKDASIRHIMNSFLLCLTLFVIWYFVMTLVKWYDPRFHLLATFSSVLMVSTGRSWGIIEQMVA